MLLGLTLVLCCVDAYLGFRLRNGDIVYEFEINIAHQFLAWWFFVVYLIRFGCLVVFVLFVSGVFGNEKCGFEGWV